MKAKPNRDARRAVTMDLGSKISTDFVTMNTLYAESDGDQLDAQLHTSEVIPKLVWDWL